MSLKTNIDSLAVRVATEFKTLRAAIGSNAALSTTAKTTLVAAINELKAAIDASTSVNDAVTNATTTYSSQKIVSLLSAMETQIKSDIIGGAAEAYDTLVEIQALLQGDAAQLSSLLAAVGNRLRIDDDQGLNETQKAQGRANLDVYSKSEIGDFSAGFVATFEAALI